MPEVEKIIGGAIAGAVSLIAVLLLAKPLLEAFSDIAKEINMPVTIIVGLLLFSIAAAIFQKMTR